MTQPLIVKAYADNGEFSHYELIDIDNGLTLWSENPEQPETNPDERFKSYIDGEFQNLIPEAVFTSKKYVYPDFNERLKAVITEYATETATEIATGGKPESYYSDKSTKN